jgi:ankyrin repeat protein
MGCYQSVLQAVELNDAVELKRLVDAGYYLDFPYMNGQSVLMKSVEEGRIKMVEILLDGGARINLQNHNKATALILACITVGEK